MAYVVFDTETTGLHPELGDRIIEIAAVRVVNGEVSGETFQSLINPGRPIPEEALKIHGIRSIDVEKAPSAKEVIPAFLQFVGSDTLVAQNAEFDMAFLQTEMQRLELGIEKIPKALCTVKLSKLQFPNLRSYNLDSLMKHLGITADRRHRALDDVKATAEVFLNVHHEEPTLF